MRYERRGCERRGARAAAATREGGRAVSDASHVTDGRTSSRARLRHGSSAACSLAPVARSSAALADLGRRRRVVGAAGRRLVLVNFVLSAVALVVGRPHRRPPRSWPSRSAASSSAWASSPSSSSPSRTQPWVDLPPLASPSSYPPRAPVLGDPLRVRVARLPGLKPQRPRSRDARDPRASSSRRQPRHRVARHLRRRRVRGEQGRAPDVG